MIRILGPDASVAAVAGEAHSRDEEVPDVPLPVVWDGVAGLREFDPPAYEAICGVLDEVAEDHEGFSATVIER